MNPWEVLFNILGWVALVLVVAFLVVCVLLAFVQVVRVTRGRPNGDGRKILFKGRRD